MARDFLPISHPVYHLVYVGKMVDLLHVNCSANFVNRAVRSSVDVEVTYYKKKSYKCKFIKDNSFNNTLAKFPTAPGLL